MIHFRRILVMLTASFFIFTAALVTAADDPPNIPPKEEDTLDRLNNSPRHGEWITYTAEKNDKVDAWIVYPEIKEKAPVVIVIHEIYGLNDWARAVADQLAKDGFIAIAPDLLSGKAPDGKGSKGLDKDAARALMGKLDPAEVIKRLDGAAKYATSLAAADKKYAVVGFCWGGGTSFSWATTQPKLSAAIVYYGTSPDTAKLKNIKAPVLGLYGGKDNRVNATIEAAENELKTLKKTFEKEIYDGAGHAFLRQQDGMEGANSTASKSAWPRTIDFLKKAFNIKSAFDEKHIIVAGSIALNNECHDK